MAATGTIVAGGTGDNYKCLQFQLGATPNQTTTEWIERANWDAVYYRIDSNHASVNVQFSMGSASGPTNHGNLADDTNAYHFFKPTASNQLGYADPMPPAIRFDIGAVSSWDVTIHVMLVRRGVKVTSR